MPTSFRMSFILRVYVYQPIKVYQVRIIKLTKYLVSFEFHEFFAFKHQINIVGNRSWVNFVVTRTNKTIHIDDAERRVQYNAAATLPASASSASGR